MLNNMDTIEPLDEKRNITIAQLTKDYGKIIDKQRKILHDTLKILPIGYHPDHTINNIPALVHSWVERALQAEALVKQYERRD